MGQSNSNFELASEARRAAERFDECEIKVIKETFKDLCNVNGGSMRIDKETFLQYLPLPGLLGERLFAVFDKKSSGEIDYEEFVCGLAVTCRGSWDEKVEFIFNLYDIHGQGAVNRDELAALLNHVPKSIMRFGRAVALDATAAEANNNHHHHHHTQSHGGNHHHPPHREQPRRSSAPTCSAASVERHHHHPAHHAGRPQRHPPPSSAGTVSSALSAGRCSPDHLRASSPPAAIGAGGGLDVVAPAAALAGGGGGGGGSSIAAGRGVMAAVPGAGGAGREEEGGGAAGSSPTAPLLTCGNLMQLHASLSSNGGSEREDSVARPQAVTGGGSAADAERGSCGDGDGGSGGGSGSGDAAAVAAEQGVAAEAEKVADKLKGVTAEAEGVTAEAEGVTAEAEGVTVEAEGVIAGAEGVTADAEEMTVEAKGVADKVKGVTPEPEGVTADAAGATAKAEGVAAEEEVTAEASAALEALAAAAAAAAASSTDEAAPALETAGAVAAAVTSEGKTDAEEVAAGSGTGEGVAAAAAAVVAASATPGSWVAVRGGGVSSVSSPRGEKEADIRSRSSGSSGGGNRNGVSSPPVLATEDGNNGGDDAVAAAPDHEGYTAPSAPAAAAAAVSKGGARGSASPPRAEGREPPVAGLRPERAGGEERAAAVAVAGCAAHAAEPKGGSAGGEGESSGRSRRGTARSDSSTEGGASCAATQHHPHWEIFTNNDIVDQAFEECDLNQTGKLTFPEFRLWVERNPIVTQFLQSVFPYDEHREWGDDRKHLPFIHNRDFTASPMRSEPSVGGGGGGAGGGEPESPEYETRRLLMKARNTTRDEALRENIDRLIEQVAGMAVGGEGLTAVASVGSMNGTATPDAHSQHGDGPPANSGRKGATGNVPSVLLSELSPRSAKVMQNQTVAKQGFLWKQGYRLKTWKQRWYVLVGNCIYYYHHEADVYPSKVMFLTGSFVEPLQEVANERKGYWGIEISRNREQKKHRRRWYTRSKVEQLKWVKELRKASAVVPIEDDFEIGEELGKGRFSRVCMCVNKHTLERNAVKIIMKEDMKQDEKDLLRAEIAIMRLVNHPNIIRMEAVYESKKDIFIVMQLHSGGELFDRIVGRPRFTEDEAFTVMYPLVESVAYLHEMGIVHRDLKPENILCGDRIEDIKIADFGLSKMVMPDEIMKMPCGTLTYVAPEVLTLNGYGKEADIWSVGTIMYLLLRGRLPFDGETREEIIENTIHGAIAWQNDPVWANFSEDGKDLVLGMLNKDREKRYTAKAILAHPWITQREFRREEHPELFEFDF